ncbi:CoA transferase [Streptomyces narbonensis]|uniref:CoA transferase n=1 Tax=Streptomyces narbonensis TaxID=67333 RepID=A0ABV3CK20_9ACTN
MSSPAPPRSSATPSPSSWPSTTDLRRTPSHDRPVLVRRQRQTHPRPVPPPPRPVRHLLAAWCSLFALPLLGIEDPPAAGLVQGDNDVFTTSDGRLLSLATFEDKFWHRLRTELAADFPELDTPAHDRRADRTAAKERVHALLVDIFAARDLDWWSKRLTDIGAPWAPVHTRPADLLADPHTSARELFDAREGAAPQARFPVSFGAGLETFRRPAPALGEHTREVVGELSE